MLFFSESDKGPNPDRCRIGCVTCPALMYRYAEQWVDIRGRGVHSSGTSLQHFALLTLFSHALFGHREVRIQLVFSYLNYICHGM